VIPPFLIQCRIPSLAVENSRTLFISDYRKILHTRHGVVKKLIAQTDIATTAFRVALTSPLELSAAALRFRNHKKVA
jgi:hypothetical protein